MRRSLFAVGLVLLLVPGLAQAVTTSRLTGTVVDREDVALPGVTVSLSSDILIGGTKVAITDVNGAFSFNLLPPGEYNIKTDLTGFVSGDVTARVHLDRATQVRIMMVMEEFADEIVVTAEAPVVDTTNVTSGESYSEEFLQKAAVGMGGRDYLSIIGQAGGTGDGTGNITVMGGVYSDNVYLVDGLNTTDPITATFGTNFNYDAIQEVSIQTSGFEAEYGQALGGVINLVTKSGGNEFSGSFDARYRDESFYTRGEHYDPDVNVGSVRDISATLGGPIMRDRLWFFASIGDSLSERTPTDSPVTREFDGTDWIAKVTWQASDAHRVQVKVSGDPAKITHANANWNIEESASRTQEQGGEIYQAELNSVLTDSLLMSLQVGMNDGYLDSYPTSGDYDRPGYLDITTGVYFGNYRNVQLSERDSTQAKASLSYFVDDLLGPHEFKGGVEYRELKFKGNNYYSGGAYIEVHELFANNPNGQGAYDLDGDGYTDETMTRDLDPVLARSYSTSVGDLWTYYLQDAWRPIPNLTVKPGIRLDTVVYDNQLGTTVADYDEWQPRIGLAWDFLNDGKQVLRVNWGRFMHPGSVNLSDTVNGRTYAGSYTYTGYEFLCRFPQLPSFQLCDRDYLTNEWAQNLDPGNEVVTIDEHGNEHYWYRTGIGGIDAFESVDTLGVGHLQAQWMENFSIGIERQLWDETSIEIEYVNKNTRDLIEDTCKNNTWVWDSTQPRPSFDDPTTWTDEANCSGYVLSNPEGMKRDYDGYIFKFESRMGALHILGNYTYSTSKGNSDSTADHTYAGAEYDAFPRDFTNLYGYMPEDARHRVKLNGYVTLPWDMTAGFDYFWSSGIALDTTGSCSGISLELLNEGGYDPAIYDYCQGYGTTAPGGDIYVERRGSHRGVNNYQLDLSLSKAFKIGDISISALAAVVNAWGDERPQDELDYNEDAFHGTYEYGEIVGWGQPRRYEVGFRIEF